MTEYLYFLVEGGKTLELAHKHVADREATVARNIKLIEPLGVTRYFESILDGTVCGVVFEGRPHQDFKKPNRHGYSTPKAKTEWAQKFEANAGYDKRGYELAKLLGVPTTLRYKAEDCDGMTGTSSGIASGCGFLYLSPDGPFALYVPDIAKQVADYEARGYTVNDECKNFRPEFDGARPILKEEWELIVAQRELKEAKRRAA